MVYGFVKQSGGHARIDTEPGRGTAVHLFLPRAAGAAAVQDEPSAAAEPTGSETILVVEDDELVRANVESQLEALGYSVSTAADAQGALALLESGAPVDLLFTDVIMPGGMNGRQLAEAAQRRRPDLKVLFTSGYSRDLLMRDGKLDPSVQLLSKPYRRQDMARKVRAALHPAPPQG
jgi:CheY-like chemotaxis protein